MKVSLTGGITAHPPRGKFVRITDLSRELSVCKIRSSDCRSTACSIQAISTTRGWHKQNCSCQHSGDNWKRVRWCRWKDSPKSKRTRPVFAPASPQLRPARVFMRDHKPDMWAIVQILLILSQVVLWMAAVSLEQSFSVRCRCVNGHAIHLVQ